MSEKLTYLQLLTELAQTSVGQMLRDPIKARIERVADSIERDLGCSDLRKASDDPSYGCRIAPLFENGAVPLWTAAPHLQKPRNENAHKGGST